jgi:MbtH protein
MHFIVVKNNQNQYSLWSVEKAIPKGWQAMEKVGAKEEYLAFINEQWKDFCSALITTVPANKVTSPSLNADLLSSTHLSAAESIAAPVVKSVVPAKPNSSKTKSVIPVRQEKAALQNDTLLSIEPLLQIYSGGKESPLFFIDQ